MQWLTTMMTRTETNTLFCKSISDITGMFSWNRKRPNSERPRTRGMDNSQSFFCIFLKSCINKTLQIGIIFSFFGSDFQEIFHRSSECHSPSDMWRTWLPSFWYTSLFIAIGMHKIYRSASTHRRLPCFLENFPESENSDTSICHHLMP